VTNSTFPTWVEAVCQPCPPDQYQSNIAHQEESCLPWTVCNTVNNEQYEVQNGSSTYNRQCGSNVECSADQYESQAPYTAKNKYERDEPRLCESLTACQPGQFEATTPTLSTDRVCGPCDGETEWQNTTNAQSCSSMSFCGLGEKVSFLEGGSRVQDLQCVACDASHYQDLKIHREVQCKTQPHAGYGQQMSEVTVVKAQELELCPEGTFMDNGKHRFTACINYTTAYCTVNERMLNFESKEADQK